MSLNESVKIVFEGCRGGAWRVFGAAAEGGVYDKISLSMMLEFVLKSSDSLHRTDACVSFLLLHLMIHARRDNPLREKLIELCREFSEEEERLLSEEMNED